MFSKKWLIAHDEGQSLIEVVVALAIALLVIVALVNITTIGVRNAQFSKKQEQAVKLAQEGMEWVRQQRDQSTWTVFLAHSGKTYCLKTLSWTVGLCSFDLLGGFKRELYIPVTATKCTGDPNKTLEATITVSWQESKRVFKSEQISCFTNWQNK